MQIRFDPWVERAAVMKIAEDARLRFGVAVELVEVRDTNSNPISAAARSNIKDMRAARERCGTLYNPRTGSESIYLWPAGIL